MALDPEDLAIAFIALNNQLHEGRDRSAALQRLVALAASVIPGCESATITEWSKGDPSHSVAASTALVAEPDRPPSDAPVRDDVLSFVLADQPQRVALDLYPADAGTFDHEAVTIAALFAAHARVLLTHAASVGKATHLEHALVTSRQIGAAIGILMNRYKITDAQAFTLLRRNSQHLHRKLHEIAYDVIQTGALPDPS